MSTEPNQPEPSTADIKLADEILAWGEWTNHSVAECSKLIAAHVQRELTALRRDKERLEEELEEVSSDLKKQRKNTSAWAGANHRQIGVIQAMRKALRLSEMPLQIALDDAEWREAHVPEGAHQINKSNDLRFALEAVRAQLASAPKQAGEKETS